MFTLISITHNVSIVVDLDVTVSQVEHRDGKFETSKEQEHKGQTTSKIVKFTDVCMTGGKIYPQSYKRL